MESIIILFGLFYLCINSYYLTNNGVQFRNSISKSIYKQNLLLANKNRDSLFEEVVDMSKDADYDNDYDNSYDMSTSDSIFKEQANRNE
jgi:hypothetical protein